MQTFKKLLAVGFVLASAVGFSQKTINEDVSIENGKIRIQVTKELNGKKEVFDKTYNAQGLSETEKQALIDRVTDSLTADSGKNMKMRVKVDRENGTNKNSNKNSNQKKIIIEKNIESTIDNDTEHDIDIEIDGDDMHFDFDGKDFDMHDLQNKIGDLGRTLQFKFDELGPQMKKWGDEMEPHFKKFSNGEIFDFDGGFNSSKTVKSLNAYPNKPSNNKLNVKFTAPEKGDITITVTDLNGKEVGKEKIVDFSGEYFGQVEIKGNVKGTVFVTVVQGADGTVKRVVL